MCRHVIADAQHMTAHPSSLGITMIHRGRIAPYQNLTLWKNPKVSRARIELAAA